MKKLIGLALLAAVGLASAQSTSWVNRYNSPTNTDEFGMRVTTDGTHVYVGIQSIGEGSGYDFVVAKYDFVGNIIWERRLSSPGQRDDVLISLAPRGDGRVAAVGYFVGNDNSADAMAIQLDANGNEEWRYVVATPADDVFNEGIYDSAGDFYVCGNEGGDQGLLAIVAKVRNGSELWRRSMGQGNPGFATIWSLTLDPATQRPVYTGQDVSSLGGIVQITGRLRADGVREWQRTFSVENGLGYTAPYTVHADANGNVTVAGIAETPNDPLDGTAVRYDTHGNVVYEKVLGFGQLSTDYVFDVIADQAGNAYFSGQSISRSGFQYAMVYALDPLGNLRWRAAEDGGNFIGSNGNGSITFDSFQNVVVAGQITTGTGQGGDIVTTAYSPAGSVVWSHSYNGPNSGLDFGGDLVPGANGQVYVVGTSAGGVTQGDTVTYRITPGARVSSSAYTVTRGSQQSGVLSDLFQRDGSRVVVQQRAQASPATPNVQVEITGISSNRTPSSMTLRLVLSSSGSPRSRIVQRVEVFDFTQNAWSRLNEREPTSSDTALELDVPNPARHINQSTGEMRVRLSWFDRGATSPGWVSRLDEVAWLVQP